MTHQRPQTRVLICKRCFQIQHYNKHSSSQNTAAASITRTPGIEEESMNLVSVTGSLYCGSYTTLTEQQEPMLLLPDVRYNSRSLSLGKQTQISHPAELIEKVSFKQIKFIFAKIQQNLQ